VLAVKIKCPDGAEKTVEECQLCEKHCLPKPVRHALLHNRDRVRAKKEKPAFGVTSLVDDCLRKSFYKLTTEEKMDLEKLWIFSRGHAIHSFITHTLDYKEREIFAKKEFPQFDIIGFIDALHDGVIYEFKTTNNIPEVPQEHHVLQGQAYFSMLPEETQKSIKKILVVYLSLQKIKTFESPRRDISPLLEGKAAQLTQALRLQVPPQKEVTWMCNYCEFRELCENETRNGSAKLADFDKANI
jgi:CRISPR/Cas system-associated exonuclease Cas4 (RecB family)